jgi:excinuclease UvrABC ATPase subunit
MSAKAELTTVDGDDLGPKGGHAGGEVVITGTPEEVAACKESYTGRFLKARMRGPQL